jgi:hypothetical protein
MVIATNVSKHTINSYNVLWNDAKYYPGKIKREQHQELILG